MPKCEKVDETKTHTFRQVETLGKKTASEEWLLNSSSFHITVYTAFLFWRFVSLALYSVYATECFLRAKLATLRCENFTIYPSPTKFEIAWQFSSAINAVIAVAVLFRLPEFPGLKVVSARLVRIARFWSFLFQLVVVVTYNLILFFHEHLLESAAIEVGFIVEEISVAAVVCLWNFSPAPKDKPGGKISWFVLCYYLTLLVFFLENFFLFLLMSSQAALDITGIHEFESRSKGLQALGIVLNATEATFYFAVMKFMWNKLFESNQDLLEKDTI